MSPIVIVLLLLGAIGHTILWAAAVNRVHALGVHRRLVHAITLVCGLMLVLLPLVTGGVLLGRFPAARMSWATVATYGAWTYVGLCTALCVFAACQRLYWRLHPERRGALVANHTSHICPADSSGPLAAGVWAWVCHLPGNEVLHVCVHEKKVAIPRLAASHAPVRIAHLTDLHMSGRVGRAYFEQVVEEANACKADIVAVTGDIVERENCIDWIPATLARLRAEGGVYYVLGNHDQEVNVDRLNAALTDAGLVHLGGACHEANIRGTSFILAGNELPWFESATDLSACPAHNGSGVPVRILLSHSPDQFAWAQANDIDLVLAGHLHGGQVRLPVLGPILAPSLKGVRYAAGVFRAGNTVMHVSRGTGSLTPLRYNCPPEVTVLELSPAKTA